MMRPLTFVLTLAALAALTPTATATQPPVDLPDLQDPGTPDLQDPQKPDCTATGHTARYTGKAEAIAEEALDHPLVPDEAKQDPRQLVYETFGIDPSPFEGTVPVHETAQTLGDMLGLGHGWFNPQPEPPGYPVCSAQDLAGQAVPG